MTNLKTLKEIGEWAIPEYEDDDSAGVLVSDLRREAIKWVKMIDELIEARRIAVISTRADFSDPETIRWIENQLGRKLGNAAKLHKEADRIEDEIGLGEHPRAYDFIMRFFNLTEEDLK